MKNDLTGLALPTCDIMVNGQKRKLYGKKNNKVYLHNGDNFQLKVFNPLQERIAVSLKINGVNVDNDVLVINPGQEFVIERYIGTNRKLTFSSYEIDTTNMSEERIKEATKAIEKNGVLEIIFWNEKIAPTSPENNFKHTTRSFVSPGIYAQDLDNSFCFYSTSSTANMNMNNSTLTTNSDLVIDGNLTVNGNLTVGATTDGIYKTSGTSGAGGTKGTNGASGTSGGTGVSGVRGFNDVNQNNHLYNKIETGRIEKGDYSNQQFKRITFEIGDQFYKIKFKLLPFSIKPVKKKVYNSSTIKQIVEGTQTAYRAESTIREYCKCGYRISRGKGAWNNCPMCGKKIK